jgi:hypothetical protein
MKKFHNYKLHQLYSSPHKNKVIKSGIMNWLDTQQAIRDVPNTSVVLRRKNQLQYGMKILIYIL